MMTTALLILAAWVALSLPVAIALGKWLRYNDTQAGPPETRAAGPHRDATEQLPRVASGATTGQPARPRDRRQVADATTASDHPE